jgi:radical SAM superfamily enzyme YgiQ (UPF0313 family)
MKKVVLLAINAKYVHSSLSVWVIAGGVAKYARLPHEVNIVEATIHQPDDGIAGQVASYQPDVVGISTYIWNAGRLPALLKLLRERLPGAQFVLGGPEASFNADYWLAHGADHVLPGEGEHTFPAFLDEMAQAAQGITGCESRGRTQFAPTNYDEYIAALGGRIAYLETSRGCPFSCAFCLSAGSGVRFFPIDTAKGQIDQLSRSGVHTVKLVDRTFNCDPGRAYELFDYIIRLDTACRFHFEVAADLFDERTIALLLSAPPGRIQLEAGLQSYHKPALEASTRQMDVDMAEQNIRALLRGRNIHMHIGLIAGLPHEALPQLKESFDRAYSLGAHTLQLGFLKLLHGSELRKQAGALGIRHAAEPPYEIQSSPWLSAEDIRELKHTENALQHTHNKGRFLSTLDYLLSSSGLRPFSLLNRLGEACPNHGADLTDYAVQIYGFCSGLPGVDTDALRDRLIFDWLGMVKGKNMPPFLKGPSRSVWRVLETARKQLSHAVRRDEAAVLASGLGAFVDSEDRDPVTGLYKVYLI